MSTDALLASHSEIERALAQDAALLDYLSDDLASHHAVSAPGSPTPVAYDWTSFDSAPASPAHPTSHVEASPQAKKAPVAVASMLLERRGLSLDGATNLRMFVGHQNACLQASASVSASCNPSPTPMMDDLFSGEMVAALSAYNTPSATPRHSPLHFRESADGNAFDVVPRSLSAHTSSASSDSDDDMISATMASHSSIDFPTLFISDTPSVGGAAHANAVLRPSALTLSPDSRPASPLPADHAVDTALSALLHSRLNNYDLVVKMDAEDDDDELVGVFDDEQAGFALPILNPAVSAATAAALRAAAASAPCSPFYDSGDAEDDEEDEADDEIDVETVDEYVPKRPLRKSAANSFVATQRRLQRGSASLPVSPASSPARRSIKRKADDDMYMPTGSRVSVRLQAAASLPSSRSASPLPFPSSASYASTSAWAAKRSCTDVSVLLAATAAVTAAASGDPLPSELMNALGVNPDSGKPITAVAVAAAAITAAVGGPVSEFDMKRNIHNVLERKRRNDLKDSFTELREVIPEMAEDERTPKAKLLKEQHALEERLRQLRSRKSRA
ncbi:hypothetical protein CAOG_06158 [Capsaspora owczarzaki ATCC 30864]|uniref:hypothetical protein n=1 Tax=Capsaspora owczarzaki (strain ATCC 30864) TaxID=595528 RepID=UPI0001FE2B59|nr:hypothetical protein CAOG_06158 [Capsaspora owczarzaki ATCC 30864]|eukprot:XP_004345748.1 hypothetical protein CAOG_06158 [Capsaspora owczarzaki ATCC 30864]